MSQKSLSKWLKAIIGGMAVCGAVIYFYMIPIWGRDLTKANPEYASWYLPWLIAILISGIPCYMVLYFGWKISTEIGRDNSFSMENAELLKKISILSAIDSLYFFVVNVVFMMIGINHPGVFLISMLAIFAGVVVTVAAAALSHLVRKAAEIQEENEFTI